MGFDDNDLLDLRMWSVDMANVMDGEFADLAVWTTSVESCQ